MLSRNSVAVRMDPPKKIGSKQSGECEATIDFDLANQTPAILVVMQKWEYKVFASHLDPAELVIILNESGLEGWELVTIAPVTDYHPLKLIEPTATMPEPTATVPGSDADEGEVVALDAFRYIFKRPVE
jgi:hypothetical protein